MPGLGWRPQTYRVSSLSRDGTLLLATAALIDSSSRESALEPPFLGCSRRGEKEEAEEIPKCL